MSKQRHDASQVQPSHTCKLQYVMKGELNWSSSCLPWHQIDMLEFGVIK